MTDGGFANDLLWIGVLVAGTGMLLVSVLCALDWLLDYLTRGDA